VLASHVRATSGPLSCFAWQMVGLAIGCVWMGVSAVCVPACVCADGVLDNLLEQYMAELRGSTTATPCQQQQQFDSNSSEDGQACGVCLDAAPSAMIVPCEHTMCGKCLREQQTHRMLPTPCMLSVYSLSTPGLWQQQVHTATVRVALPLCCMHAA
jgi:hypothetical protein